MAFVDELLIQAKAGNGGTGVVRWRREKFVPLGGPAGGNGGKGGDVYLKGVRDRMILARYKGDTNFAAANGESGRKDNEHGKNGQDLYIEVPTGSIITQRDSDRQIRIDHEGQIELLLKGGKGGLGNTEFKSSRNTTPMEFTPGEDGEGGVFLIELELIADIGLIGFPNAGKSSLLNALTNSHSKVGDYPFTTLEPSLGVMDKYVIADIPGLIEGASEGRGLGHKFLKHVTRTKILVHLISASRDNQVLSYKSIRTELGAFSDDLLKKEELVLLSQADTVSPEEATRLVKEFKKETGKDMIQVSVIDDAAMKHLREVLLTILSK